MKPAYVTAAALAAAAVAAPVAATAQNCFDKATLTYVDCAPEPAAPLAPPPPIEPIQPWTGLYLGAHGGYGVGEVSGVTPGGAVSEDLEGFIAGGQIGFLKQYPSNIVLGLELDGSTLIQDDNDGLTEAEIDWMTSARARLGVAADQVMPYVTGGVALVGWQYAEPGLSVDDTAVGLVAGGGLELLADENWLLRIEGLYYFLDEEQDVVGGSVGVDDVIVGRGGISYKF